MNKLIQFSLFTIILFSCSGREEELLEKISSLEAQVTDLENQVDDCKNGPTRVSLAMKNAFEEEDYSKVVSLYNEMETKHSGTSEFSTAKDYFDKVMKIQAEKRLEREREEAAAKAEKMKALNKLRKKLDDVSGITWYQNPYFTHYTNSNLTSIYIGDSGGSPFLRLKMSYKGDSWIFFENAYLSHDGNTKEIQFDRYQNKETENSGGSVWEWIDVSISDSMIPFLKELASSSNAKMRLSGKYTKTRNLSQNERRGILDVLNGYEALKSSR